MAYKCFSERKNPRSLTLNQKLEMTKRRETGVLKPETGQKLGFSHVGTQVVKAKEKPLREIQRATPVNT